MSTWIQMMKISMKRSMALVATIVSVAGLSVSTASAMPTGLDAGLTAAGQGSPVVQVSVGQHRIQPGSKPNSPHPQHAKRNSPDLYCDKQENKCM